MRRRSQDDWDAPPSHAGFDTSGGLSGPEREGAGPSSADWGDAGIVAYQMRKEQNLLAGVIAGLVAASVGVTVWVLVVSETGAPLPILALGLGYLVGFAVRWAGKGLDKTFGIAAGLITFLGCIAGTVLSMATILAARDEIPLAEFLENLDPGLVILLVVQSVGPIGAVVWLFAIYESFRVAQMQPPELQLPAGEHDREFEKGPEDRLFGPGRHAPGHPDFQEDRPRHE